MNKSFVFVGLCIRLALVLSMAPVLETARAGPLEDGEEAYRLGNYASAMKFFRKAADRGDPKAQTYIGVLCFQGQSVSRNFIEAEKWFRKAALQGNSAAQTNLGLIFYHGLGRVKDYAENWQVPELALNHFHERVDQRRFRADGLWVRRHHFLNQNRVWLQTGGDYPLEHVAFGEDSDQLLSCEDWRSADVKGAEHGHSFTDRMLWGNRDWSTPRKRAANRIIDPKH